MKISDKLGLFYSDYRFFRKCGFLARCLTFEARDGDLSCPEGKELEQIALREIKNAMDSGSVKIDDISRGLTPFMKGWEHGDQLLRKELS